MTTTLLPCPHCESAAEIVDGASFQYAEMADGASFQYAECPNYGANADTKIWNLRAGCKKSYDHLPRYEHVKTGGTYRVLHEARLQMQDPLHDTKEMVVYQSETDGSVWCRPRAEFHDGRFRQMPPDDGRVTSVRAAAGTLPQLAILRAVVVKDGLVHHENCYVTDNGDTNTLPGARIVARVEAGCDSTAQAMVDAYNANARHVANEWADLGCNGVQWLRNIRDGISTAQRALEEMEPNLARVRALSEGKTS